MFSSRFHWDLQPNRLTGLLAAKRKQGARVLDLTQANPTRAGIEYPDELRRVFDDARLLRVEFRQASQRFIHRQDFLGVIGAGGPLEYLLVHGDGDAAFESAASAGVVHQEAAHELGGHAHELGVVLPVGVVLVHQPEVGLVDQGGGLERVPGPFVAHATARYAAQLPVNQRHEPLQRVLVPEL